MKEMIEHFSKCSKFKDSDILITQDILDDIDKLRKHMGHVATVVLIEYDQYFEDHGLPKDASDWRIAVGTNDSCDAINLEFCRNDNSESQVISSLVTGVDKPIAETVLQAWDEVGGDIQCTLAECVTTSEKMQQDLIEAIGRYLHTHTNS